MCRCSAPFTVCLATLLWSSITVSVSTVLFTYHKPSLFKPSYRLSRSLPLTLSTTTTTTTTNTTSTVGDDSSDHDHRNCTPIEFKFTKSGEACHEDNNLNHSREKVLSKHEDEDEKSSSSTVLIEFEKKMSNDSNDHDRAHHHHHHHRLPLSLKHLALKQKPAMLGEREFLLAANAFITDTIIPPHSGFAKTSPNGEITVINGQAVTPILYHQERTPSLPRFERLTATTDQTTKDKGSGQSTPTTTSIMNKLEDEDDDDDDDDDDDELGDNKLKNTQTHNKTVANKTTSTKPSQPDVKDARAKGASSDTRSAHDNKTNVIDGAQIGGESDKNKVSNDEKRDNRAGGGGGGGDSKTIVATTVKPQVTKSTGTTTVSFDNKSPKTTSSWMAGNRNKNRPTLSPGANHQFQFGDKKAAMKSSSNNNNNNNNNEMKNDHRDKANNETDDHHKTRHNNASNSSQSQMINQARQDKQRAVQGESKASKQTTTPLSVVKATNQESIEKLKAKYNKRPGSVSPAAKSSTPRPASPLVPKLEAKKEVKPSMVVENQKPTPGTSLKPTRFTAKDVRRPNLKFNKWKSSQQSHKTQATNEPDRWKPDNSIEDAKAQDKHEVSVHHPSPPPSHSSTRAPEHKKAEFWYPSSKEKSATSSTTTTPPASKSHKYFHRETLSDLMTRGELPPRYKLVKPSPPPELHGSSTTPAPPRSFAWNRFNEFVPAIASPKHISYRNRPGQVLPSIDHFASSTMLPEVVVTVENKYVYVLNKTTTIEQPRDIRNEFKHDQLRLLPISENYLPETSFPSSPNKFNNFESYRTEDNGKRDHVTPSSYFYYEKDGKAELKPEVENKLTIERPRPETTISLAPKVKHYPPMVVSVAKPPPANVIDYGRAHRVVTEVHAGNEGAGTSTRYHNNLHQLKPSAHVSIEDDRPMARRPEPNRIEYYNVRSPQASRPNQAKFNTLLPEAKIPVYARQLKPRKKWKPSKVELDVPLLTDLRPKLVYPPKDAARIYERYGPQFMQTGPELTEDKLIYTETIETVPPVRALRKPLLVSRPSYDQGQSLVGSSSTSFQRPLKLALPMPVHHHPLAPLGLAPPPLRPPIPPPARPSMLQLSYVHSNTNNFIPMLPPPHQPRKVFTRHILQDSHQDDEQRLESHSHRLETRMNASSPSTPDPFEEYYSDRIIPVDSMIDYSLVMPRNPTPLLTSAQSSARAKHSAPESSTS